MKRIVLRRGHHWENIVRSNTIILIAGLLMAAPVTAAEPAQPQQQAQPQPQSAEQSKVVCRKEAETGSLLKKRRVCRSKRDWEVAAQASRDAISQGQMSGGSSGN